MTGFFEQVEEALQQVQIEGSKGAKKQTTRTPVEAPDNLRSRAYIRVVDLVSEGPIYGLVDGLKSVYLDDTPVMNPDGSYNFKDLALDYRLGTPDQDFLPLASSVEKENDVNTQLKKQFPYTFTVSNTEVDALRLKIRTPSLQSADVSTGDTNGTTVEVDIYTKRDSESSYTFNQRVTISGKTTNPYEKETHIELNGPGPWQVRLIRVTDDSTSNSLSNDTVISGYTEIIYARLRYPYSALFSMSFDAEQFGSVPSRAFEIKGVHVRVPTNYDPVNRTYSGIWNGTWKYAWSNNPAWCYLEMLTNRRFGLGKYITDSYVDTEALYEVARYCDELVPDGRGGMEPRFACNAYIQTRQEAYALLQSMTSVFRAMVFWAGSRIIVSQDRPQDPVWRYTNANVVDGQFAYNSTRGQVRHNVCYVSYNNPDNNYKLEPIYYEDADGIREMGYVNPLEITAWGCTSRGQALRLAKWAIYSELNEKDMVTFQVSLEGLKSWPGCTIEISDSMRKGLRHGGRIVSMGDGFLEIDAPLTFQGNQQYTIGWITKDGRMISRPLVPGLTGNQTKLWVGPLAESDLAVELGIWTISSSSLSSATYRILGIEEDDKTTGLYTITAIEYHAGKFDEIEKGIVVEEAPTVRKANPNLPTNLTLTDELYVSGAQLKTSMTLAVDYQAEATQYLFSYRRVNGVWVNAFSFEPAVTIMDVQVDDYEVRVQTINALGLRSDVVSLVGRVWGKTKPPADVTGFAATLSPGGILLNWKSVKDLDIDLYEVRRGVSWDSGELIGQVKGTSLTWMPPAASTQFTFFVKAKDTSGNYSRGATTLNATFQRPDDVKSFSVVQAGTKLRWKWVEVDRGAVYEVRCGESYDLGEPLFRTSELQYEMEWGRVGTKTFWIKAYDYIGNASENAYSTAGETAQPSGRNQVLLYNLPQQGWPGSRYNTKLSSFGLELVDGESYGEFYYSLDIGKTFRSILTIDYTMLAYQDSGLTWGDLDYAWNSEQANIPWLGGGDFTEVGLENYISYRTAIQPNVVVSFRLDGDLASEDGKVAGPVEQRGVSYGEGRFARGLLVQDKTLVRWKKTLGQTFSLVFTTRLGALNDMTGYLVMKNDAGDQMRIRYDRRRQMLILDTTFVDEPLEIPLELRDNALVVIGVSQSKVKGTRNLFAQRLGYPPAYGSAKAANLPQFTDLALFGHFL